MKLHISYTRWDCGEMPIQTEQLTYINADRRMALYKRTDTKIDYWQARFRIEGQRKYKNVGTKQTDFEEAKCWALCEFERLHIRVKEYNEALTNMSFGEVARRWLIECEHKYKRGDRSKGTFERNAGTVRRYLLTFFGKNAVGRITRRDLDEFRQWRDDNRVKREGASKRHKNAPTPKGKAGRDN